MAKRHLHPGAILLIVSLLCYSCSRQGPMALFKKQSPHDQYAQRLKDAGLDRTAMGGAWLQKGENIISKTLSISIPYRETGYFAADKIQATALQFEAKRGQKLHVVLQKKPEINFAIFMDLLRQVNPGEQRIVASADTNGTGFDYEIGDNGSYILRLQPELLRSGEYTLTITAGPSLSFPVSAIGKPNIGSFWGDGRDENSRKHEGIDIFAVKHTPAIAATDGTVTRVGENKLGGLVVFMRPEGKDYNLYYAHLDKQLVQSGQTVRTGDTLGLVGNTGNARTTPSHLHFGIYTGSGAVDPLPFVNRNIVEPRRVSASLKLLNSTARTTGRSNLLHLAPSEKSVTVETLPVSTAVSIEAATDGWYKVMLPNGLQGYMRSEEITSANTLRKLTLARQQPLLDAPNTATAARVTLLTAGKQVNIRGSFSNYFLVNDADDNTGWIEADRTK